MNSKTSVKKLGTDTSHKKSMISNLGTSLILHEYMKTTVSKAKVVIPFMERLISVSKGADNHSRKLAYTMLRNETATNKVFDVLLPRFKDTTSGFIKVYKLGRRKGDNSEIVRLVLMGYELPKKKSRIKESKKVEEKKSEDTQEEKKESKGLFSKFPKIGRSKDVKGNQNTVEGKSKAKSRSGI